MRTVRQLLAPALVLGTVCAITGPVRADYLYSVFRDSCPVDTTIKYSAAEPIIATVHLEKTEVNRVASNYMTYGGFSLYPGTESFDTRTTNGVAVKHITKTRGHLFGMRLFKEKAPNSNQWEFMPYTEATVLNDCGADKTCLFDAGKLLTDRNKRSSPRTIYSGSVGTPLSPLTGNEGALTVPITSTVRLGLGDIPEADPSTWVSGGLLGGFTEALVEAEFGTRTSIVAFRSSVWQPYANLAAVDAAMNGGLPVDLPTSVNSYSELKSPTNIQLAKMLKWLHGETRDWDLGDVYHASAALVEAPERLYLDRSYPQFKSRFEKRPEMIYVGANDGMIHAFHAGPDIYWEDDKCDGPRWAPGEEAWAYLPANMLAKTLVHVERGDQRFFSQDLSCRFTDVMVDTEFKACDASNWKWPWQSGGGKPYCGWRTVLVCGQGWGGSWYVALDVTDPAAPFRKDDGTMGCTRDDDKHAMRAMWEFTHLPATAGAPAMGRGWSLPFIGLVNNDGTPRWLGGVGSGYNTDMQNCPEWDGKNKPCEPNDSKSGSLVHVPKRSLAAFRVLNLEYDGQYPQHGDGIDDYHEGTNLVSEKPSAWIFDVATGEVLNRFDITGQRAVVADIPAVDSDFNGLIDAAYVAGWGGKLARIQFGDTRTTSTSIGLTKQGDELCAITTMQGQRIVANHPTAFGIPLRSNSSASDKDKVMTVLGSGLNSGDDPDMQRNNGNFWDIDASVFIDTGSSSCPESGTILCDANNWWVLNDPTKPRLLGAPIFARQANGEDWLVYTTWSPPSPTSSTCTDEGTAQLWCLDVTNTAACKKCNGFNANGNRYSITLYAGEQPPSSPVSADGNIYVAGEGGPVQQGINNAAGAGPNANSYAPTSAIAARVTSWREVF